MKQIGIKTIDGKTVEFVGNYLGQKETKNWHYYEDDKGRVYHFRAEHMICVIEAEITGK